MFLSQIVNRCDIVINFKCKHDTNLESLGRQPQMKNYLHQIGPRACGNIIGIFPSF